MQKHNGILGGSLLVAGTAIGGGMLALPVLTSPGGFIPSLAVYFLCWLFMACTGLLFLELCLSMRGGVNIVTMAERTLGTSGKIFAWLIYLFLFYCLTLAYVVGCGNLLSHFLGGYVPEWMGPPLFVLLFAPIVYAGAGIVQRFNIFFMLGMGFLYLLFVFLGYSYINTEFLARVDWPLSLLALPVAFTAFAYQGIIPTLSEYMQYNRKKLFWAIIIGSFIPLATYVIWQWLILGIIPYDAPGGLEEALKKGQNAVAPLREFIGNPIVYGIGQAFAFLALLTSFFGVTLGLVDFLADGLKITKEGWNRVGLCAAIFLPPLAVAMWHPDVFLTALDFAGGFGCATLLGLLPIVMVWSHRQRYPENAVLGGGDWTLSALMLFVLFEIAFESYLVGSKFFH